MKRAQGIHVHHHYIRYPVTLRERLYSIFFGPFVIIALIYAAYAIYPLVTPSSGTVSMSTLLLAALATLGRLTVAYILAVICAVPLALLATKSKTLEAVLLPIFDVLESVPILAVFPVILILFIRVDFLNGAAIFILFLNMLWNIVFALIGGLKVIPKDIGYAAQVFGVHGFAYVRRVILPAVFPPLVTGSILAVADGWNIIIVAEALHAYIPHGTAAQDLFGIGTILVSAAANAQNDIFLAAIVVMVSLIALLNFFVWQKLLHFAQRFRFE